MVAAISQFAARGRLHLRHLPRLLWLLAFVLSAGVAHAQAPAVSDGEKEIERYRAMINDPMANPGYLSVDRGEALWALKRGERNVSLETCDLGQGAGKLEGAAAHLPRYFADTDRVMDLEQRLLFCMRSVQGLDTADVIKRRFGSPGIASDMEDLVAFIANKSNGMVFQASLSHPKEREAAAIGEAMFYRRSAVNDFSCATCHGAEGRRIRLQGLVDFSKPNEGARAAVGTWPAYRVSQSETRTMQHRLWDCYRQMRMPVPDYASDGLTDLAMYLAKMGDGATLNVPYIKR